MTDGQRELVRYRMERACETLQEARLMVEGDYGEIVELKEDEIGADLAKAQEFIARIESKLRQSE